MVQAPRRIEKPWGFELIWAQTDRYVGKELHIRAGHQLSRQYHRVKDEAILVISGVLRLEIGDPATIIEVQTGESFHVTPGTIHRFGADTEDVRLVEVSTPELDDVVRLQDHYGRAEPS